MKKVMIASVALFFAAITGANAQTAQVAEKKEVAVTAAQQPVEKKEAVANTKEAVANTQAETTNTQAPSTQPAKTAVKPESLPEAVKTTMAGEDYKGWIVSSAFLVKDKVEFYELVLTKDKESKTVKVAKDGKLIM